MDNINLDNCVFSDINEVVAGIHKVFKLTLKNGDVYYFKANYNRNYSEKVKDYFDEHFLEGTQELCGNIIEVLVSDFLEHLNCDFFVKYNFASYKNMNGCVSKSYVKNNTIHEFTLLSILENNYFSDKEIKPYNYTSSEEEFDKFYKNDSETKKNSPFDFTIPDVIEQVKIFANHQNFYVDIANIQDKLKTICVYDYFMSNLDRNWQNIKFLLNKENDKLKLELCPIFDNGECFDMEMIYSKNNCLNGIFHLGLEDSVIAPEDLKKLNKKLLAEQIYKQSKVDTKIKAIVDKVLNLDIKAFVSKFEKNRNIKLTKKQKECICNSFVDKVDFYKSVNGIDGNVNAHDTEEEENTL